MSVFGYASRAYEELEDLAEQLDYAPLDQREAALKRYLEGLNALTALRGNTQDRQPSKITRLPQRPRPATQPVKVRPYLTQPETNTWRIA
ncbi:hypothetical protein [Nocardia niwae]|uniref:hypothetical protein n=1 Tax=Nocardia niwae TaxID=626084 RepID=UPI000A9BBC3C|nr:hypothetical protein [Nocardia niwae]